MISPRPEPVGAQVVLHQRCGRTSRRVFELDGREFWVSAETSERTLLHAEAMIASRIRGGRRAEEYTLSIPAPGPCGFGMSLYADPHGIHVSLGGLEQEFSSIEEAMPWVRRAMSPSHRLHIVVVGRKPAEWTLEDVSGEQPLPVLGSSRLTFFRRFRVVSHLYRSNGSRHHEWCASAATPAPGHPGGLACPGGIGRVAGGANG